VSTNSTKRVLFVAQFDSLIIFSLLCSLLVVLFFYYTMSLQILIPSFFGTKKFREKKLDLISFYGVFTEKEVDVKFLHFV
jgi:hypothetical protein